MTLLVPRPYQVMIRDHVLDTPRCAIFAGMGSGKSSSTLLALDALSLSEGHPVLILAPLRVATSTWPEEVMKWDQFRGLSVVPIVGDERQRKAALAIDAPIYTTNYEQLPWLVAYWGDRWPYRTVISDELTRLKSMRTRQGGKRPAALAQVAHTKIKRFVGLTGTPASNGLADLWGQMWFVDRGQRLGKSYSAYMQRWFVKGYDGFSYRALPHAQAEIQDLLKDVCLTIDAKDWFDLKEPILNNVYVNLPIKARQHYKEMEKAMFTDFGQHQKEAFGAAARTMACLQIASGTVRVEEGEAWHEVHDVKVQALESIVEEANGAPVLCAYHFRADLDRLLKAFPKGRHLDKNPQTIKDWNKGKIPILFAHPASAGHGLNLQDGGNILVYFTSNWNLEEHMQILERVGPTRQLQAGHDRPVFVHRIIARDTIDELVLERLETKKEVQTILLDAMKSKGLQL